MSPSATGTQSVLDAMTAGIMGRKSKAAAKLTPVVGEVQPIHKISPVADAYSGTAGAPWPFDDPQTTMTALKAARQEVLHVMEGIDRLLAIYGVQLEPPTLPAQAQAEEQRARDRAADERVAAQAAAEPPEESFDERLSRLTAEAQKAVFAKVTEAVTAAPVDGWVCPEHGKFQVLTSRRGRQYRACTTCEEFERLI